MKKSNIFILVFTLFLCLCISQSVSAQSIASGKVIILAMDRIGWSDIIDSYTPNIDILIDKGGIGLMTTNTVPTLSQKNEYITLGSGVASSGSQKSQLCFSAEEYYKDDKAKDVYSQITGNNIKQGSIVNLGIAQIYKANKNRPYTVNIGAIGTVLKDAGYNTAVIGNSDTPDQYKRYLVSMLMDNEGIVSCGDVSQSLITNDNTKPFGIKTDYTKMKDAIDNIWDKADVIGIELGDTSRAEDFRNECTAKMLEYHRKKAIEEADRFIGYLLKKANTDTDLIMIISPVGPLKELSNRNRLSPIIAAGRGVQNGWLRSGSTHRDGVITNMDIGATILGFFNLPALPGQLGNKIHSIYNSKGLDGLWTFNQKLVSLLSQRHFFIRSYIYIDILIIMTALILLLFRHKFLDWIKILLLFVMIVPLVYLILPIFYTASLFKNAVISVVMGIAFTATLIYFFPNTVDMIFVICMGIVSCLVIDQISGGHLIKDSPLGYDVISGARFYGIGNEYMGILIGASCTATAILVEKLHKHKMLGKLSMIAIFSLVFGILVSPDFGANVGGAISAFFAFLTTYILITGRKLTIKRFVAGGCILTCLLLIVFIADSTKILDTQTHMGQTASLVRQKGIKELLKIFQRKISMNIKLIKYTVWTKVFLTSLLAVVILFFRPVGLLKEAVFKYSAIPYGFIGGLVGCIVALLANDSGIVAAATMVIYVAPPVILLIIDQVQNKMRLGEKCYGEG